MKNNGNPCGTTSESRACEGQACERDCTLKKWTAWSACSKVCDGGTQKRQRHVELKALGDGKCWGPWSKKRLEHKKCNMHRCVVKAKKKVMQCKAKLDVIMLLDGSASLGSKGWKAELEAADMFISAFNRKDKKKVKAKLAVILFSGPRTHKGVKPCVGSSGKPPGLKKCGIDIVTHFTKDLDKVAKKVSELEWPKGSTLTSLALATAKDLFMNGRKNAEKVVVGFTDGRPYSYRKTWFAARDLRKSARLAWVAITKRAPLKFIKLISTRRWQENLVLATSYKKLMKAETVTHVIADICPPPPPMDFFAQFGAGGGLGL